MRKILEKLNKHFFPLVVAFVLVLCLFTPVSVSAAKWYDPINYQDYDYSVRYGSDYNKVSFVLPEFHYYINICLGENGNTIVKQVHSINYIAYNFDPDKDYIVRAYPASSRGLLLENIPVGSKLSFDLKFGLNGEDGAGYYGPDISKVGYYYDADGQTNRTTTALVTEYEFGKTVHMEFIIEDVPGAKSFVPMAQFTRFEVVTPSGEADLEYHFVIENATLEMDISTTYWQQWQNEQNGQKLDDIEDALGDVRDSVEDSALVIGGVIADSANAIINGTPDMDSAASESNEEMSAAAGKLDNLGDQLNSVNKPNANNMDVSADRLLGGMAATTMLTAPIREIWNSPVALSILTVVLTIVLISWVFFGKK